MLKLLLPFSLVFGGILAVPVASAATYEAHVEQGNTVVIVGKTKKAEPQRCATKVMFEYTDPKEPGKRQTGFQVCQAGRVTPGKPTEMCRMDYPVVDITLKTKVMIMDDCYPS